MSLQPSMSTRRQFLERSTWGFGSFLVLPGLLASCTDHLIDPQPPITLPPANPPLLGDEADIDWNEDAKTLVASALTSIPEAAGLLSGITQVFWPTSKESPWDLVRTQVSEVTGKKLDDAVYIMAKDKLDILHTVIQQYLTTIKYGQDIKTIWSFVHDEFVSSQSAFTRPGYEVLLLPFFTQFANLYLTLLRDPLLPVLDTQGNIVHDAGGYELLTGVTWNMTGQQQLDILGWTKDFIAYATQWVDTYYGNGRDTLIKNTPLDAAKVEPFRSVNAYDRMMTMLVLDYRDTWLYYYATNYPHGAVDPNNNPIRLFTRTIYSDPYGNLQKNSTYTGLDLPSPATQFPNQLSVWGGQDKSNEKNYHIYAVQLTYPDNGGPDGVTTTPRMGVQDGGVNNAPYGGTLAIASNPIIAYNVSYQRLPYVDYEVINTLQFAFSDKTISNHMGGITGEFQSGWVYYPNYALSSIYIHGSSRITIDNNAADCVVFGLMREGL